MPSLYLIRHAKAAWPLGVPDFDRPLAERGIRDCEAGRSLLSESVFDSVLVSAANRTQVTANLLSLQTKNRQNIQEIYEASLGELLHVLNSQKVETLAIIGHSPGMPLLAWYLSGNHDSVDAKTLRTKYPTLGIAKLEADLPFSAWEEGSATLVNFFVPRADKNNLDSD